MMSNLDVSIGIVDVLANHVPRFLRPMEALQLALSARRFAGAQYKVEKLYTKRYIDLRQKMFHKFTNLREWSVKCGGLDISIVNRLPNSRQLTIDINEQFQSLPYRLSAEIHIHKLTLRAAVTETFGLYLSTSTVDRLILFRRPGNLHIFPENVRICYTDYPSPGINPRILGTERLPPNPNALRMASCYGNGDYLRECKNVTHLYCSQEFNPANLAHLPLEVIYTETMSPAMVEQLRRKPTLKKIVTSDYSINDFDFVGVHIRRENFIMLDTWLEEIDNL